MSETRPQNGTASLRVIEMRDDFLLLVQAFNSVHDFRAAIEAQSMVIALNKFEDDHDITQIAWPPRLDEDGDLAQPDAEDQS